MKLPGQEELEAACACENVPVGQLDSGPSSGPCPDDPSDTGSRELGPPEDPPLFLQLNELLGWPQTLEWREMGRWVLFEEKLEVDAGRWSAPHVPTLALPSLQNLRSLLAEGLVLLDCPAQNLLELVEQVTRVESLSPELRGQLQALLLQRPQHHTQTTGSRPCWGPAQSRKAAHNKEAPMQQQCQSPLRQKLPPGAEAGAVLAGELGFLAQPLAAFVRLRDPVWLGPLTEVPLPSRFFCLLLGPPMLGKGYHELGRAAAVLLSDPHFQWSVRRASNLHDLLTALDAFLEEVTVLPPGRWDPTARIPPPRCLPSRHKRPPLHLQKVKGLSVPHRTQAEDRHRNGPLAPSPELQRTGRLFGGLVQDVRRKASWYPSDFSDALHPQCVSAVLYIYLATVTNAITFGGLLGDATDGAQGVLESLLGTAVAGAAFCLMAGQPLTVLSSTGPVLVFERLLFAFCRDYSLDYLPFRLWVGIWVAVFCLALVATEASVLVRYFTRFTEEGFCALISLIFIYDAVGKMLNLAHAYPIQRPGSLAYGCLCQFPGPGGNESQWTRPRPQSRDDLLSVDLGLVNASLLPPHECVQQGGYPRGPGCHTVPDIAFFSLLLFLTSFLFAIALKHMKTSRFFPSVVRKVLSDFSSILAILLGCGLDALLGLAMPKLMVPREFKPTLPGRGWLVPPFGANPWWLSVAAALPALLLSILIFMDQQITAVILNRVEYRLRKGAGFHLDLFCVALLMLLTSVLGLPWYVSATVLSLAHMDSLRRESRACAPGEPHSFLGIREQRLTGLAVFTLTGVSIFLAPVLKFIPMPVLYGIFLYMGVAALSSIQFMKRVQLMLMPAKHQPDLLLLRHVPLSRVHLFTAIQLACLGLLWIIKSTPAAIIFPLMLLGLVGVRKALEWVFSPQELLWLDELMPEEERNVPEKGLEPGHSFSGSDSEDSELMYQPKAPEINISVN
ncbi:anion exchange protein 4 [Oryctolagus cuniculus]|uniref:Anion exchange protein 4 n=1 Tax=Oryctolagus cuniculus TaxID=9986 RepID=B3A4_RABIT|nr:anion exchange protein 4 [Oryctolagus cuniculus]Q9GKY1.2 RecName: Full=Anion exchange protein 4; Short=AE 4; Short=Anion exchanger 4; AltName: Full=Solute carrier family 4 member 9 [Oryctolagus cuniculus]BAB18935.1 anion exchanger 4a [Oryctolagus cuniculus]